MLSLLLACAEPDVDAARPARDSGGAHTSDTSGGADTSSDTSTAPGGPLLLCGGGSEGEVGEASWSDAYARLVQDTDGDGTIRIAILSTGDETDWLPGYFVSLGADDAFNLKIGTRSAADAPEVLAQLATADAIFLKGGDQGQYYDAWNDTGVDDAIVALHAHGGVIGGTSAGAMSQAEYALAGGNDYATPDVLADAMTPWLDDLDGGSGIHPDFLGLLPGVTVDTHFSTRARLGRLAGTMAKAIDEGAPDTLLGIGVDEQTCLTVEDGVATVSGVGSVVFLRAGDEPAVRVAGQPLVWPELRLDRLTEGWAWALDTGEATPPADAEAVSWDGVVTPADPGDWSVSGAEPADEEAFVLVVDRWPDAYGTHAGTGSPVLPDAFGLLDAFDEDLRGVDDEAGFRTLYDHLGAVAFFVADDASLRRTDDGAVRLEGPSATLVIDASQVTARSLSPTVSTEDAGDGALHAAGLLGLRLHLLASDSDDGRVWEPDARLPRSP